MDTQDFNPLDESGATVPVREFRAGQKIFHRYTLKKELGRGGMGVVWLAHDDKLEQEIALKFLPESVRLDPSAVDELKRETRRSLKLTHPNIVRIHDFVDDDAMAGISMEFVDGSTLSGLRSKQPQKVFSPSELTPLIRQLCGALDYAHNDAKVIHRDLKPSNLMVTSRRQIKVADFGIARSVSDSMSRVTANLGSSGTLVYMSPQQLAGIPSKPTDDVYALGATIYELLAGRPPFYSGDIPYQIRETTPISMMARREELEIEAEPIPEQWEEVIASCLAKDPAMRPQSAGAVAAGLSLAPATDAPTASSAPLAARTDAYQAPATSTRPATASQSGRPATGSQRTVTAPHVAAGEPPVIGDNVPPTAPAPPTQTGVVGTLPRKSPVGLIVAGVLGVLLLMGAVWYFASRPKQQASVVPPGQNQSNATQTSAADQQKIAEETQKLQDAAKKLDAERQKADDDLKALEAERQKAADQAKADEAARQHAAEEQQKLAAQEAQQKADAKQDTGTQLAMTDTHPRTQPEISGPPKTLAVPGDYASIASAMQAARSGDTVQVKSGTYSEMIQLKEGVKLVGEGMETTTVQCPATSGSVLLARGCGSGSVTGFTFEHTGSDPSPNRNGVVALLDSNVELYRCIIRDSGGHGLVIKGGWNSIHDCTFRNNAWDGVFVSNRASPSLQNNRATDNQVNGISFQFGATGVAEGNAAQDNQDDGIYVSGAGTSPVLKTNKCTGNTKMGIGINERASAVAEGNTCQDNAWSGIAVLGGASGTLSGNHCIKNKANGIDFGGGSTGRAEGNFCLQNVSNGILIDGAETSVRVVNNQCNYNFKWGIRVEPATASQVEANRNQTIGNKIGQIQRPEPQ